MEENFAKLEADLRGQLERAQQELRDTIIKSQQDMMSEISQLLQANLKGKGAAGNPSQDKGDPSFSPGFVTNTPKPSQGTATQGDGVTSHQAGASTHAPSGLVFNVENVGDSVPDLDEIENLNKMKAEFSKQLEETRKDLEEKFRIKEEEEGAYGMNARDLSLVPDLIIPPKFKTPEFEKFDGTTCPTAHITMFCRKMTGFIDNEKLLIHCFQDSLAGPAVRWYNQLTRAQIRSWKDLAKAFTDQYRHITDMVPNRLMLQSLEQRPNESLREYAQRWRDVAAQVQPPLRENEISPMFVDTLKGTLYDRLISNPIGNFSDMVMTGERIEAAIKSGRIDGGENARKQFKKKDHDVNNVGTYEASKHFTVSAPQVVVGNAQGQNRRENRAPRKEQERMTFTPLPIPYKEVYKHLYEADLVRPYHVTPFQPPYPIWYDEKAHCEYHGGVPGHTIENCLAFKKLVQNMINNGVLELEKPNVTTNPLPKHEGRGVNVLEVVDTKKVRMEVSEIKSPLIWVYEQLCVAGLIKKGLDGAYDSHEPFCEYHQTAGHEIQSCPEFKKVVQELMDNKEVEFLEEV